MSYIHEQGNLTKNGYTGIEIPYAFIGDNTVQVEYLPALHTPEASYYTNVSINVKSTVWSHQDQRVCPHGPTG